MIEHLHIENFRRLRRFDLSGLGRVNLLVGINNSGKTTVLEALEVLASEGSPHVLWNIASRRGERIWGSEDGSRGREVEVAHLFTGHALEPGKSFHISGGGRYGESSVRVSLESREEDDAVSDSSSGIESESFDAEELSDRPFSLVFDRSGPGPELEPIPVSPRGGVARSWLPPRAIFSKADRPPVRFISHASLSADEAVRLFSEVVLTPEEHWVLEALRTIDADIERIAVVPTEPRSPFSVGPRGGVLVKCRGFDRGIPIGSLGDGIWRMLGLSVALVNAEKGVLLVDEIDTGLHFSVMSAMWRLIRETARRLDVQVFATTHSRDCYESLASIARADVSESSEVTIQRIEPGKNHAVAYSEQEIIAAAEHGIEVR